VTARVAATSPGQARAVATWAHPGWVPVGRRSTRQVGHAAGPQLRQVRQQYIRAALAAQAEAQQAQAPPSAGGGASGPPGPAQGKP
jgi:hypothetical protein